MPVSLNELDQRLATAIRAAGWLPHQVVWMAEKTVVAMTAAGERVPLAVVLLMQRRLTAAQVQALLAPLGWQLRVCREQQCAQRMNLVVMGDGAAEQCASCGRSLADAEAPEQGSIVVERDARPVVSGVSARARALTDLSRLARSAAETAEPASRAETSAMDASRPHDGSETSKHQDNAARDAARGAEHVVFGAGQDPVQDAALSSGTAEPIPGASREASTADSGAGALAQSGADAACAEPEPSERQAANAGEPPELGRDRHPDDEHAGAPDYQPDDARHAGSDRLDNATPADSADAEDAELPVGDGASALSPAGRGRPTSSLAHGSIVGALRRQWGIRADVDLEATRPRGLPRVAVPQAQDDRKYQLGDVIAEGGMGRIVIGLDCDLRRSVAVKILREERLAQLTETEALGVRERFVEEAQVTGQLEHPNIVPVHDLGVVETGDPFYTMKLLRAQSLGDIIESLSRRKATAAAQYTLARLLRVFLKVCDGVAYAHARGVIHRDLKPDNIMVGEFGEVTIIDWGLAKVIGRPERARHAAIESDRASEGRARTEEGTIAGTLNYMPPEQARGYLRDVDTRADVYALGTILYELVAHVPAFESKDPEVVLQRVRAGHFVPPTLRTSRSIPKEIETVVLTAMAFEPDDRYATVTALKDDIEAFLEGRLLESVRYSAPARVLKWARRHPIGLGLTAAIVAAIVGTVLVGGYVRKQDRQARAQAAFDRSVVAFGAGDFARAEKLSREAAALDPQEPRYRRAVERAVTRGLEVAVFARVAKDSMARAQRAFIEGERLYAKQRYTEAYEAYLKAQESAPLRDDIRRRVRELAGLVGAEHAARAVTLALQEATQLAADIEIGVAALDSLSAAIAEVTGANPAQTEQLRAIAQHKLDGARRTLWSRFDETFGAYRRARALIPRERDPSTGQDRVAAPHAAQDAEIVRQMTRLLVIEHRLAREAGEPTLIDRTATQLRALVTPERFDREFRDRLDPPGRLVLAGLTPRDATVSLFRFLEGADTRSVPVPYHPVRGALYDPRRSPRDPPTRARWSKRLSVYDLTESRFNTLETLAAGRPLTLSEGAYLLVVRSEGSVTVRIPFVIASNETVRLAALSLPSARRAPPGMVYVAPGTFSSGGDPRAPRSPPRTPATVARPFWLDRQEVTVGDYAAYCADLARSQPAAAASRLPRTRSGQPLWHLNADGSIELGDQAPDVPITGISAADAFAYAAWRSARDGRSYRLPTETEWEWAARGADGRPYPWGRWFNAAWTLCANSPEHRGLEPLGLAKRRFLADESPCGVFDLAGGVRELTETPLAPDGPAVYTARGGHLNANADQCRAAARFPWPLTEVSPEWGFRLAADLAPR